MHEADKIRKLKGYAQAVLAAIEGEAPATDPALARGLEEVRSAARETLARAGSPLKVGVVGEFNAGKSLLLGSLLGYADALPVSEVPTTGNVTALWVKPRPGLQKTEFGPFRVEFLSRETALECLRELLRVADGAARG